MIIVFATLSFFMNKFHQSCKGITPPKEEKKKRIEESKIVIPVGRILHIIYRGRGSNPGHSAYSPYKVNSSH